MSSHVKERYAVYEYQHVVGGEHLCEDNPMSYTLLMNGYVLWGTNSAIVIFALLHCRGAGGDS